MVRPVSVPVVRLAPHRQWDQALLDDLLSGDLYPHGVEFERLDAYPRENSGICLVVPGRYWADRTAEISEAIAKYRWVLAFRVGDEEDLLNTEEVVHASLKWWIQTPRIDRDYGGARFLPIGYTPHFRDLPTVEKSADVFLSAQRTHARRVQCFEVLARSRFADNVHPTDGFTHGMKPADYAQAMAAARVAPAPAGPVSADSFRFWEALESHAIPIADTYSPADGDYGYWERMHPDAPYPILRDYQDLPGYIEDALADYPRLANRIAAWWIAQKRAMALNLREDLQSLGAL